MIVDSRLPGGDLAFVRVGDRIILQWDIRGLDMRIRAQGFDSERRSVSYARSDPTGQYKVMKKLLYRSSVSQPQALPDVPAGLDSRPAPQASLDRRIYSSLSLWSSMALMATPNCGDAPMQPYAALPSSAPRYVATRSAEIAAAGGADRQVRQKARPRRGINRAKRSLRRGRSTPPEGGQPGCDRCEGCRIRPSPAHYSNVLLGPWAKPCC